MIGLAGWIEPAPLPCHDSMSMVYCDMADCDSLFSHLEPMRRRMNPMNEMAAVLIPARSAEKDEH